MREKTWVFYEKPLRTEKKTKNKLNPHNELTLGFEPGHTGGGR